MPGLSIIWTSERSLRISRPVSDFGDHPQMLAWNRSLASSLAADKPQWIIEIVPSAQSVLVVIDPLGARGSPVEDHLTTIAASIDASIDASWPATEIRPSREMVIPVCYDRRLAPDLDDVAGELGMDIARVALLHGSGDYLVETLGFMPGFAYLSGLPEALRVSRLAEPRHWVPAGSVAIAGAQSAVYPGPTPGGWRLIGRTPTLLFDSCSPEPALLRVGDRVRFEPISLHAYNKLAATAPTTGNPR